MKSISFVGLLTIVFITLKLTNHIDWGWGWVLSPLWISAAFGILILVVYILILINRKDKVTTVLPKEPIERSRWQMRIEEMQKRQQEQLNNRNN